MPKTSGYAKVLKLLALILAFSSLAQAACTDACITLSCPQTAVASNNTILITLFGNDSMHCGGLAVAAFHSNGSPAPTAYLGCLAGSNNYSVTLPYSGSYLINASNGSSVSNCSINYFQTSLLPRRVPELNPVAIMAAAAVAFMLVRRK